MKTLKLLLIFIFGFFASNLNAQIKDSDLILKVNKNSKKIEIFRKSDNTNITNIFKLNSLQLDVFEKSGEYAGSLNLNDWSLPLDEFTSDEIIKISVININVINTNQTIVMKDFRLDF